MNNITSIQYTGFFNKEVKENRKEEEKGIQRIVDDEKEKVAHLENIDSRGVKEYNLNGRYREDYDTKKHLDIFA